MDRRGFLQRAMIAASALLVDPEQLLWEPGKKLISIPKPTVNMVAIRLRSSLPAVKWRLINEGVLPSRNDLFNDLIWIIPATVSGKVTPAGRQT